MWRCVNISWSNFDYLFNKGCKIIVRVCQSNDEEFPKENDIKVYTVYCTKGVITPHSGGVFTSPSPSFKIHFRELYNHFR